MTRYTIEFTDLEWALIMIDLARYAPNFDTSKLSDSTLKLIEAVGTMSRHELGKVDENELPGRMTKVEA